MHQGKAFASAIVGLSLTCGSVLAQQNLPRQVPGQQPQSTQSNQAQQGRGAQTRQEGQAQPGQAIRQGTTAQRADLSAWQGTDQLLGSCVAISNQKEVAISRMAKDKLQNEEAQKFADMMIEDHTAFLQKLSRFAPAAVQQGLEEGSASDRTSRGQETTSASGSVQSATGQAAEGRGITPTAGTQSTTTAGGTTAGGNQAMMAGGIDVLQLEREVAQQCLNNARELMSKKEGAKADQCYIGFQIAAHAAMRDKLQVFQRHASQELRPVLAEGLKKTEEHMAEAEKIMKTLDEDGHSGDRNRSDSNRSDKSKSSDRSDSRE